jgi:signal transduction histidine kinase
MGMLVAAVVLGVMGRGVEASDWVSTVILLGMTAFATVGALIASRHPRNPIGWVFSAIGFGIVLYAFRENYVVYGLFANPGSLPGVTIVAWLGSWIPLVALISVPFVFLLFPDGRPPSSRWRPVGWIALASMGLVGLGNILVPGRLGGFNLERIHIENPTGIPSLRVLANGLVSAGALGVAVAGVGSVVALVVRFRRSGGEERQQLRWLAYVAAAATVVPLIGLVTGYAGVDLGNVLFPTFFLLLLIGVPVACGIAILKYRVLDLDIVIKKTVVFGAVVILITSVYLAVVVVVGPRVERGRSSVESLVATIIVVLAFQPVSRWARRLADRVVYGKRATPYEVLSGLSDRLAASYSTDDVLPRLVQILAAGTGATKAEVWLRVGPDALRRAARWPVGPDGGASDVRLAGEDLPAFPGMAHAFAVRHQAELLGALTVAVPPNDPLTPSQEKLLTDLAAQAGLVLRNVRLVQELRASRQRIVAAQDERAKALERNLHDGAQQQLVALAVKVRLMERVIPKDPQKALAMARELEADTSDALENLRDLARGIYPPLLADQGLAVALEAQARKSPVPTRVDANGVGRYPQDVETAVYFCVLEALQNVAKYAEASSATVRIFECDGMLAFEVADDGRGFDSASTGYGTGLQGMADRLDALGGTLEIRGARGEGTAVRGRLPAATSV